MRTDANRKALNDVAATVSPTADKREKEYKEYIKCDKSQRFNMPVIPHAREKTVLDELLKNYKNKISIMRAIMRLPKSEIRDIAMNAILEAFTK